MLPTGDYLFNHFQLNKQAIRCSPQKKSLFFSVKKDVSCFFPHLFQEEKDGEPPKDSLDDLFPNDEEEHAQGSKWTTSQHSY